KEGTVSGMLTYRGNMFNLNKVIAVGSEVHALGQADIERMPAQHASVGSQDHRRDRAGFGGRSKPSRPMDILAYAGRTAQPEVPSLSLAERQALAAKKITIDVMILYTRKVASRYLDVDKDVAAHSIQEANASFVNSDIGNVQLRLVHSQEINYDESDGE